MAQLVKNLHAMQETWVQSLGWEDPLENEMVIHSSTLAWRIPWTEDPGELQSVGLQRVGHNPLQYSGLENSRDCIVLEVTESQTQLNAFHFHFSMLYLTYILYIHEYLFLNFF